MQNNSPVSVIKASPADLEPKEIFLTRAEAAAYLRRSVPTMERWAANGSGPEFRRVGGRALYALAALRRFAGVKP